MNPRVTFLGATEGSAASPPNLHQWPAAGLKPALPRALLSYSPRVFPHPGRSLPSPATLGRLLPRRRGLFYAVQSQGSLFLAAAYILLPAHVVEGRCTLLPVAEGPFCRFGLLLLPLRARIYAPRAWAAASVVCGWWCLLLERRRWPSRPETEYRRGGRR